MYERKRPRRRRDIYTLEYVVICTVSILFSMYIHTEYELVHYMWLHHGPHVGQLSLCIW